MITGKFEIFRKEQIAANFGLEFFANGYSRQVVYTVLLDGLVIKQHISTKFDENLFAIVEIGVKCKNGIPVIPAEEMITGVKFTVNQNKKIYYARKVILQATK